MPNAALVFCDVVGFSEIVPDQQKQIILDLSGEVMHELFPYTSDVSRGYQIITLPTGDGIAVAFVRDSWGSAADAIPVARMAHRVMKWALPKDKPDIRIGIHYGSVELIRDINGMTNVCGKDVNTCQRVMDAAHRNQILISAEAAQRLYYDFSTVANSERENAAWNAPDLGIPRCSLQGPYVIVTKHGHPMLVHTVIQHHEPPRTEQPSAEGWRSKKPYAKLAIVGRHRRTRYIADRLQALANSSSPAPDIGEVAMFGTFGIYDRDIESLDPEDQDMEHDLKRQRDILQRLIDERKTRYWLVLTFGKLGSPEGKRRLEALIAWLERYVDCPFVRVTHDPTKESINTLLVKSVFTISGHRVDADTGYELSILEHDHERAHKEFKEFKHGFKEGLKQYPDNHAVLDFLRATLKKW